MKKLVRRRLLDVEQINRRAAADPQAFIAEENGRYQREIEETAAWLADGVDGCRLVMLSGPSAAGKTTSSMFLRDRLKEHGIDTQVVSLDNFYRGRYQAPQLEDGSYDYEALEALNLERLHSCMREILLQGRTELPVFDFQTGRPAAETQELTIGRHSIVIFEGIHALNPIFEQHMPQDSLYKVFVNTVTPIYEGESKILARRQLRLVRRILRDMRFRGSPIENTLHMWQQVVRGESAYMFPYVDTVDALIDTTHAYEPCIFAGEILPVLERMDPSHPQAAAAQKLFAAMKAFAPMAIEDMPQDTLLREFVGGGRYS